MIPRTLKASEVSFDLSCENEDMPIRGQFASGDDEQDRQTEEQIASDYDRGNSWAWCCVKVTATWEDFEGVDYLGGCSYASEKEFKSDGYYEDMKEQALADLNKQIEAACLKLAPLL